MSADIAELHRRFAEAYIDFIAAADERSPLSVLRTKLHEARNRLRSHPEFSEEDYTRTLLTADEKARAYNVARERSSAQAPMPEDAEN
jgi:hypothetical protein